MKERKCESKDTERKASDTEEGKSRKLNEMKRKREETRIEEKKRKKW